MKGETVKGERRGCFVGGGGEVRRCACTMSQTVVLWWKGCSWVVCEVEWVLRPARSGYVFVVIWMLGEGELESAAPYRPCTDTGTYTF